MPVFNLDDLIQPAADVVIGGKRLILRTLTIEQRGLVQARLREIVPNPLQLATETLGEMRNPSREFVDSVWKTAEAAYRFWPPLVESEEGQHWLMADKSLQRLVLAISLGLDENHQTVSEILSEINLVALMRLIGFALSGFDTSSIDPKEQSPA